MIPKSVYNHIANAEHHLLTACNFPYPTNNAALAFFVLTSWESLVLADSELGAWITKEKIDPRIYRDHSLKFRGLKQIKYYKATLGAPEIEDTKYETEDDFKKLRELSLYGSPDGSQTINELFPSTGWIDLTDLQRQVYQRLMGVKDMLGIYETDIIEDSKK